MTCSDTLAFTPYVCGESDVDENVSRNYALTPLRPNVTMDHLKVGLETGLHLEAATKRTICVCKELEGLPRYFNAASVHAKSVFLGHLQ